MRQSYVITWLLALVMLAFMFNAGMDAFLAGPMGTWQLTSYVPVQPLEPNELGLIPSKAEECTP